MRPPEDHTDLIPTIAQLTTISGPAALNRAAEKLNAAGVTIHDIQDAYNALVDGTGHAPLVARKTLAAAVESGTIMARARSHATPTRTERAHERANTAHKMRMAEMAAEGIGPDEARRYEDGGYFHERIIGDLKDPQDIGTEQRMDPWDVVQLASAWAQRFGGGTDALRARLSSTVESCQSCARTMKGEARNDMLNRGERFARYLEGVAVKQPAQEATT